MCTIRKITKKYREENSEYIVVEENPEAAATYYDTKWSMRHQPTLYELPEDGGRLPAGTVLCTGVAASLDTTATDTANDSNGSKHTRIDIYYSTDACNTWNFLSYVTDGGESRVDIGDAMWESNLILESGKLYCFYADERGLS